MPQNVIKYTGHPLVDVGVAAITAFACRAAPVEVTVDDMERVAAYMAEQYPRKFLTGYLVCVFPNSAYVNPTSGEEKRGAFLQSHLYAFHETAGPDAPPCGVCGAPAVTRAYRQHMPMVTGEGQFNFFAAGQAGLALCGGCMLAIAALPLGALKCSGRALIVHADDPSLTLYYTGRHLTHNRRLLQLAAAADEKFPDAKQPKTRLLHELAGWAADERQQLTRADKGFASPVSLTAYHFSNSGQGPDLDIYHVSAPALSFLIAVAAEPYRTPWNAIVAAGWRTEEKDQDEFTHRNYLYEDFLRLPGNWPHFVRTYFLRRGHRFAQKDDPRGAYAPARDLALINWPLCELFLTRITNMEQHRVDTIRRFGDRVAEYIATRDKGFWNDINLAKTYGGFRGRLQRASKAELDADRPPLIGFDDFITVFAYSEDDARPDWRLARDLVLIRVIEQLHAREFFKTNPEALNVIGAAETDTGTETGVTDEER